MLLRPALQGDARGTVAAAICQEGCNLEQGMTCQVRKLQQHFGRVADGLLMPPTPCQQGLGMLATCCGAVPGKRGIEQCEILTVETHRGEKKTKLGTYTQQSVFCCLLAAKGLCR
jgi:hypothetical protein